MNSEKKTPQEELLEEVKKSQESENTAAVENEAEETSAEVETVEEASEKKDKKSHDHKAGNQKVSKILKSRRFKRGGMATAFTAVFIIAIILVNVVVSLLSERYPSMNIDLTADKVNTLSEEALEVAKSVEDETTIYMIGSNTWLENAINQSGYPYGSLVSLADKLVEANSKIKVENVDLEKNPTFANKYANEKLTNGYVVVESSKRHRVLTINDMFPAEQNSQTYQTTYYNNADSALATALKQVNLAEVPVVAMDTGHQEALSNEMENLTTFFEDNAFDVVEFDILKEDIPENTQLLFLATPTTDYTQDELAKLDTYLSNKEGEKTRTLMLTAMPGQAELPNLSSFLAEWGIGYDSTSVILESDTRRILGGSNGMYLSNASEENDLSGEGSYPLLVTPYSVSLDLLFDANNSVVTYSLATTADTSYLQKADSDKDTSETAEKASYNTIVMARKALDSAGSYYANVLVMGSSHMLLSTYLNTSAFSNGQYFSDLIRYSTDTTDVNNTVYSPRVETGARDMTATTSVVNFLGLGLFTIVIPVAILLAGLVIYFKRRHL